MSKRLTLVKELLEFSEWRVSSGSLRVKLVIIYRPPYSASHSVLPRIFFNKFSDYVESFILSPESLILTGDLNFHVDVADDPDARVFIDLLASMGLKQHITEPTHIGGHTLDLLITREHDSVILDVPVVDRYLSDHAAVLCQLNSVKPRQVVKEISYRKIKSINVDILRSDLESSELYTRQFAYLGELTSSYNFILSSLLDKHAPLKRKVVVRRQRVPWFNSCQKPRFLVYLSAQYVYPY